MVETVKERLKKLKKNKNTVNVLVDVTPTLTLVGVKVQKVKENYVVFTNGITQTAVQLHKLKDVVF